jgi:hypothetical protein
MYGPAGNTILYDNTFRRSEGAAPYVPLKLGWYKFPTKNIAFFSNRFEGLEFGVTISDYTSGYVSEYEFGWTLTIHTAPGAEIVITDKDGGEVFRETAGADGRAVARLPQYHARGAGEERINGRRAVKIQRTDRSTYTVRSRGRERTVTLTSDTEVRL